jgi:hypothetical protein
MPLVMRVAAVVADVVQSVALRAAARLTDIRESRLVLLASVEAVVDVYPAD